MPFWEIDRIRVSNSGMIGDVLFDFETAAESNAG